jgi:23S rRNA (cytidine2498-2'-O)-methyltransferase
MLQTPLPGLIYQAAPGFEGHLEEELGAMYGGAGSVAGPNRAERWGIPPHSLYYVSEAPKNPVVWQENVWLRPFRLEFDSISEASRHLRGIQRNWAPVLHTQFRRGGLIDAQLPPISRKPRTFPWLLPTAPLGAWTLLDAHTLIGSPECSSPFPAGVIEFAEDREGPPSRAYLKLWEALTRCRRWPTSGERCLDAGASPGGWTWALARLGAQVIAVDRAPLDEKVLALGAAAGTEAGVTAEGSSGPLIEYIKHDAFTLDPAEFGHLDWVLSDVICYPPRLYEWVEKLLALGICENFICTIKMQGAPDYETIRRFAAIPGSAVVHLCHNKHELTWMKVA